MRMPEDLELEKLTAVAHRSVTMSTRQRRSERSSDSPRFEYSPGSMFSPAPGDLRILWRRPPWGRCVPHPTRVQLAPTPTHGTTRHHAPALPTSTSVAHSTPPDPGSPVVSHSLAHMASQGCSAPTRSARPVTCKDRPHGIYPPRMSGPPTDTTRAVRTGIPPGRDVCTRPHVYQPDSSAPPACQASVQPAPARSGGSDPACPVAARPATSARSVPARPDNSRPIRPAHVGSAFARPTTAFPTRGRPTHGHTSVGSPVAPYWA